MKVDSIAQILAQIEAGDELHYTTIVLTPQGVRNGGIETALVIGKTAHSLLVTSKRHPETTIAVPLRRIVAVFRGQHPVSLE